MLYQVNVPGEGHVDASPPPSLRASNGYVLIRRPSDCGLRYTHVRIPCKSEQHQRWDITGHLGGW
jgi:hypothetical protein